MATPKHRSHPVKRGDHVFLIDGSSYVYRAYHALPDRQDNRPSQS